MGISPEREWLRPYYQYANRLAVLSFLVAQGINARLLFVYFTGDRTRGRNCPASAADWRPSLDAMKAALGLTGGSSMDHRIHELFLPVVEAA